MSFVAIPSLVGPMLGPVAGGLIVTICTGACVFFVNLPVGLLGRLLRAIATCRTIASDKTHPLDVVGLVLFGARHRAAVLRAGSVRRAQPERARDAGPARARRRCCSPATASAPARRRFRCCNLGLFKLRTFRAAVGGSFFSAPRAGRHPVPVPAALPDRPRLLAGPVGPAGAAAGDRGDRPEDHHAGDPGAPRLSHRAGRQHDHRRAVDHVVRDHRRRHADLADRRCRPSSSASSRRCNTPA